MADSTITAAMAEASVMPKVDKGVIALRTYYSLYKTLSASNFILMGKIPHGARVLDVRLQTNMNPNGGGSDGGAGMIFSVGTPDDIDCFIGSCTPSLGLVFNMGQTYGAVLGYAPGSWVCDISDSKLPRYKYLQITVSAAATGTKSGAISCVLYYQMDYEAV